ncbi:cystathionine beta-lyase [Acuticoccus mangrovi]|uniref:Cystathionine beta-lyase n=1 Tax=Acuticoccus mangrovi TaxID=2796142 RepID=A0A934IUM0_9HYPH|nr:cystathionine beta-lyase [Acuticoccus mangrovi]MBJ3778335.1 cystathionine beta-lyase [Acuticoccus mangrovi]
MSDESDATGGRPARVQTLLAHGGLDPHGYHGFVNPPVVHASTVLYPDVETTRTRAQRYTYGRSGTPTTDALCDLVSALEGAEKTVLAPTGLAACTVAIAAMVKAGDRILVVDNVYNPTRKFCDGFLTRFGVETVYFDPTDLQTFRTLLEQPTAVVFFEAPGSVTFEMCDVPAIIALAKAAGAVTMMDNSWATPLFFRPLEHGCDLSIHAATKYLAGHSDLLLGTVAGNGEVIAQVRKTWDEWGENAAPDDVYMTLRGMRTLDVRMERHQRNARIVAEWLAADSRVSRVLYPALPGAPGHNLWKRDFDGASSLFAITFKGRPDADVVTFVDSLRLFGIGYSWGGFESLATLQPAHAMRVTMDWPQDEAVVRLHVGLDDPADLIEDLDQAMAHLG